MTSRSSARHHVEAIGRLLGLCVAALLLFTVLRIGSLHPTAPALAGLEIGEALFDLSLVTQRERLEQAMEGFRLAQSATR